MSDDLITATLDITHGDLRWCRLTEVRPEALALVRHMGRNRTNGDSMSPDITPAELQEARTALAAAEAAPYGLSADQLAAARQTGMDPHRYAAIFSLPTHGGSRSLPDIQAALRATEQGRAA